METAKTVSFQRNIFIPFHLVDAAGIVFFGHVFTLAHQAFESFILEGLKLSWNSWFNNPDWLVPIKQTEAVYHHPLQVGLGCQVDLQLSEIRSSSFCVTYTFIQQQKICCSVQTVHVFCNRKTQQKQLLPIDLIPSLKAYLKPP
jgi:acyl-CoA thioesterase FadM